MLDLSMGLLVDEKKLLSVNPAFLQNFVARKNSASGWEY